MTDPIADFLTRIRNGLHADRDDVEMPASNFKAEIARILREQGYIEDYAVEAARVGRVLRVTPEVHRGPQAGHPGHPARLEAGQPEYVEAGTIPKVQGGMGTTIVSTSHGVMTGHEAKRAGVRRRARGKGLVTRR